MDKKLNWGLLSTAKINRALIKPLTRLKTDPLAGCCFEKHFLR